MLGGLGLGERVKIVKVRCPRCSEPLVVEVRPGLHLLKCACGSHLVLLVDTVDWAVAISVLHWCTDHVVLLQAVGRVAPKLLLAQAVLDNRFNLATAPMAYLLDSGPYPTRRQLYETLKTAGWKVERKMEFPALAVVASIVGSGAG